MESDDDRFDAQSTSEEPPAERSQLIPLQSSSQVRYSYFFLQIFAGEIGETHRIIRIYNYAMFCFILFIYLYNLKSTNGEALDYQDESHNSVSRTAERSSIPESPELDFESLDFEPLNAEEVEPLNAVEAEEDNLVQVNFICVVNKSVCV